MLELRKHYFILPAKSKWDNMVFTSVYQTLFVQKKLAMCMPVYSAINRYMPVYYEIIENSETVVIVPFCKYIGENRFCCLGNVNGFQLYDIIYRNGLSDNRIDELVLYLLQELHPNSVEIGCLPERARLYRSIMRLVDKGQLSADIVCCKNVSIDATSGHECYYQTLSKSTRQNIRTAYNRIQKENLSLRLEVITGRPVPASTHKNLLEVYYNRHASRYGVSTSKLKRFYLHHVDFSTRCLQEYARNFNAILYLGDEIAAFMAGMVDSNGESIIIPRLSINDKYLKYSPGVVLINETIKYITDEMMIYKLDLSKGAEQYKLSMGGTIYPTYSIEIKMQEKSI